MKMQDFPPMKATNLIFQLQELVKHHDDMKVSLGIAAERFEIGDVYMDEDSSSGPRCVIAAYRGRDPRPQCNPQPEEEDQEEDDDGPRP
jgi:hypothetical protein